MELIAMFLTEKQTKNCEFSRKKTDNGLHVVYEHRALDDHMGKAKDLTKEAPQAESSPNGF